MGEVAKSSETETETEQPADKRSHAIKSHLSHAELYAMGKSLRENARASLMRPGKRRTTVPILCTFLRNPARAGSLS